MFSLKDAIPDVTVDLILSKISEEQIWKRYCTTFEQIDKSFCSDLYNDRNPDCRIYYNKSHKLVYKDFGNGDSHDCFSFIQAKYNCTFKESLRIVYNDFKLGKIKFDIIPQLVLNNAPEVLKISSKSVIEIVPQAFNLVDYNYWNQYEIPLTLLQEYNVFSCSIVYLHKNGKTIEYRASRTNPIYAYRFFYNGEYSYKIYFPLAKKEYKWINNCSKNVIQGYDQLSKDSDTIILTKSLKDVICYRLLGYNAIALQSETNNLPRELDVIVNYDNDEEGIKGTNKLVDKYGFKYFYVEGEKDLSDFVKMYGLQEAGQMINNKLEQLNDKN